MEIYKTKGMQLPHYAPLKFWAVYTASVIFTFFSLFTAYSSSTYMEQFIAPEYVGLLYSAGAFTAMVLFFLTPHFLKRLGNVLTTILYMSLAVVALGFIGTAPSVTTLVVAFIVFLGLSPIIYLNIDIFSETLIGGDEGQTGSARGMALALMSVAGLAAPFTMGLVIGEGQNLAQIYFIAIGVGIIFMVFIVGAFRHFYDPVYHRIHLRQLLAGAYHNRDIRVILYTQFLLQLFFTWVVIYFPLYLATEVGLSWREISEIITVGLIAYIIFEYPVGVAADRYIGEKEMLALGFVILAITSAAVSYTAAFGIVGWMVVMFLSRIGASLVEVTTESYFFKKVNGSDAGLMSLFRLMRPLANFSGAILGSITLLVLPLNLTFIVLGIIMVTGTFATLLITDTR